MISSGGFPQCNLRCVPQQPPPPRPLPKSQKLRKATVKFSVSVCPSARLFIWRSACNSSAPTGRIFMKIDIWLYIFLNLSRIFMFHQNLRRVIGILHKDYLAECFLEWEVCRKKIAGKAKTHFKFNNFCREFCPLWDNVEKSDAAKQATEDNIDIRLTRNANCSWQELHPSASAFLFAALLVNLRFVEIWSTGDNEMTAFYATDNLCCVYIIQGVS